MFDRKDREACSLIGKRQKRVEIWDREREYDREVTKRRERERESESLLLRNNMQRDR